MIRVSKGLGIIGALSQLGNINTSMAAAMLFNNLSLDIFGCELKPNEAVSDEYAFCSGGSGQKDVDLSTAADQGEATGGSDGRPDVPPTPSDPSYAQPVGEEGENNEDLNNATAADDQTPIRQGSTGQVNPVATPVAPIEPETPSAQGPQVPSSDRTNIRSESQVQIRFGEVSVTDQKVTVNGVRLSPQESVAYYQEELRAQRAQLKEMKAGAAAPGRDELFRSNAQTFIDDLERQIRINEEALKNEQRRGQ